MALTLRGWSTRSWWSWSRHYFCTKFPIFLVLFHFILAFSPLFIMVMAERRDVTATTTAAVARRWAGQKHPVRPFLRPMSPSCMSNSSTGFLLSFKEIQKLYSKMYSKIYFVWLQDLKVLQCCRKLLLSFGNEVESYKRKVKTTLFNHLQILQNLHPMMQILLSNIRMDIRYSRGRLNVDFSGL